MVIHMFFSDFIYYVFNTASCGELRYTELYVTYKNIVKDKYKKRNYYTDHVRMEWSIIFSVCFIRAHAAP